MNWNHPKIYGRAVVVVGAIFVASLTIAILPKWSEAVPLDKNTAQVTPLPMITKTFLPVSLEAKSAIVWDVEKEKVIYEKNIDEELPLASITKIMTALVASEIFAPNDIIPISTSALAGGSNAGLIAGDNWTAQELIDYKLTTSANGASSALREAASGRGIDLVAKMNDQARAIGLSHTVYLNETGLDVGTSLGGSYGSVRDMALLMSYIIKEKPNLMTVSTKPSISSKSATGQTYFGSNTNDIVGKIPGLIASKTGYTLSAGGNLAVAFDAGLAQPIVIVVLGSTKDGRFTDVLALVRGTIDYFSS